ncbi:tetratricopeptide repeat protein [Candidatus Poribacteria bacterium]|nr:tetratricopeptide repeat protein [Candidatus Poribacteria bacterium]
MNKLNLTGVLIVIIFLIGCTPKSLRQGNSYIENGEYPQALEVLTDALNNNPDNPKIHRSLGIAYYKTGQYEQALDEFEKAKQKLDDDGIIMFYSGLSFEQLAQYDRAIEEYSNYVRLGRFSSIRSKLRQRVQQLIPKQAAQWAKDRMKTEKEINPVDIPDNSIAVAYFKPLNISEELRSLHIGLTDLLILDLSMIKSLRVIERVKLKEIYEELGFSTTDFVDENTTPRMGKLLGASSLVTGVFTGFGDEQWRIDPALGWIKLDDYMTLESVEGKLQQFFAVEKELVFDVLENLDITVTEEEKNQIMNNIPTKSLKAFLAYSRGLDYVDRGMYSEAISEFESALTIDPGFNISGAKMANAKLLSQSMDSTNRLEEVFDSAILLAEEKNQLMITTLENTSQAGLTRSPKSELAFSEAQSDVELEILFQW